MQELSIIVPCRNDAAGLGAALGKIPQVVPHNLLAVETLIVDDDSSDDTLGVAKKAAADFPALHIRILARKRLAPGLGGILRYALAYSMGRGAILISAGGEDPAELIPVFLRHLRGGAHLVQCSRYSRPGDEAAVDAKYRTYQKIYRIATKLLLGSAPEDTTYGFRGFDRVFVQAIGLNAKRFNVCPEMTFKVMLAGGKVQYVPGQQHQTGAGGQSKFQLQS